MISAENRKLFESLGLDLVRFDIPLGLKINTEERQIHAIEWIREQEDARARTRAREQSLMVGLTAVGAVAAVIAAVFGIIAAWPVIAGWVH